MNDVGKGSPVIFVGPDYDGSSGLTIDALYFVEDVDECVNGPDCPMCGGTHITLRRSPGFWVWYPLITFRPLNDGSEVVEVEDKVPEHV